MVACKSPLFDARTNHQRILQAFSRMPDEVEVLSNQPRKCMGIQVMYHTTLPSVSMAELDQYDKTHHPSGFGL